MQNRNDAKERKKKTKIEKKEQEQGIERSR